MVVMVAVAISTVMVVVAITITMARVVMVTAAATATVTIKAIVVMSSDSGGNGGGGKIDNIIDYTNKSNRALFRTSINMTKKKKGIVIKDVTSFSVLSFDYQNQKTPFSFLCFFLVQKTWEYPT